MHLPTSWGFPYQPSVWRCKEAANSETVQGWISCTASNVKYKGRPPFPAVPHFPLKGVPHFLTKFMEERWGEFFSGLAAGFEPVVLPLSYLFYYIALTPDPQLTPHADACRRRRSLNPKFESVMVANGFHVSSVSSL